MAARGGQGLTLRGAESLRGERPFLFLRKKKRSFTPKKKRGPVYDGFGVDYGGLRLSALFGDHSRPLRPSRPGTETTCGSILRPPGCASPKAEYGSALRGARRLGAPSPCVGAASGRPPLAGAALGVWVGRMTGRTQRPLTLALNSVAENDFMLHQISHIDLECKYSYYNRQ